MLLADINSIHTRKWAIALKCNGIDLAVFSLNKMNNNHNDLHDIKVFHPDKPGRDLSSAGMMNKLQYLTAIPSLRRHIRSFAPDIIHAHYASSYGTLGALCGFQPFILSVWGSDIYSFAAGSMVARLLMKYNLGRADRILSTSHAMAKEIKKYTNSQILVTPFGIDLERFRPFAVPSRFGQEDLVIGTTKSLEPVYGNETLIKAFGHLRQRHPGFPLRLLMVGGGSLEKPLKELVISMGLVNDVTFTGRVSNNAIPEYLNMMDIYAALSVSESFGVSVVEASACELPVVVTDTGGLKEVVEDMVTGFVVPVGNVEQTVIAFEKLLADMDLRKAMGENGRKKVRKMYNWKDNVDQMIKIYQQLF